MRQWIGIPPKIMCRQHLIGEYREHFAIKGLLKKQVRLDGYFRNNCIEPLSLQLRFDLLKEEMKNRNYKTKDLVFNTELFDYLNDKKHFKLDEKETFNLLMQKCSVCRKNALFQNLFNPVSVLSTKTKKISQESDIC